MFTEMYTNNAASQHKTSNDTNSELWQQELSFPRYGQVKSRNSHIRGSDFRMQNSSVVYSYYYCISIPPLNGTYEILQIGPI